jgi:protein arginine kinase
MKVIPSVAMSTVNELFIYTQPAHLQKLERSELNSPERDIMRASFIRNRLAAGRAGGEGVR